MFNLLDGLEKFGIKSLGEVDLFKKEMPRESGTNKQAPVEITPEECLFDRKQTCPVCDTTFISRTVKQGKVRHISTDTDLRSYYTPVDPLYYDVVSCTRCGYTALNNSFRLISERMAEKIMKELSPQFKAVEYPPLYTAEIAVDRYKLALLNCILRRAKNGEKAYLCLKLAWLYRELKDTEKERAYQREAVVGFLSAFETESFPICGLDERVVSYIIGETQRQLGDYDAAMKWFSKIIMDRSTGSRLRDRAMEQREETKRALGIAKAPAAGQQEPADASDDKKKKFKLF